MVRFGFGKKDKSHSDPTPTSNFTDTDPPPSDHPTQPRQQQHHHSSSPPPLPQQINPGGGPGYQQQMYQQGPMQGLPTGYAIQMVPAVVPIRAPGPPHVRDVPNAIGWSCAMNTFDYGYILQLADFISLSSAAAKEAAKALRREFKHATPEAQERAVRLTGILMRNADIRFRQQVASKKFLSELSELYNSKKTAPPVKAMVLRVLSPLAYDSARDADLNSITALWNKLKPAEAPVNGAPLDPDDELLTPTAHPGVSGRRRGSRSSRPPPRRLPTTGEQMKDLKKDAEKARGNARMLSEAVAFSTEEEDLSRNEIVQEFHAACMESQEVVVANLEWATVQAEQSRAAVLNSAASPPPPAQSSDDETPRLLSNNPFAAVLGTNPAAPTPDANAETNEEKTLAILLAAHSELIESLKLYDDRHQAFLDLTNLHEVEERSRTDTRFDRSQHRYSDLLSASEHEGRRARGEGGSGTRTPSPAGSAREQDGLGDVMSFSSVRSSSPPVSPPRNSAVDKGKKRESLNPYAAYLSTSQDGHEESSSSSSAGGAHSYQQQHQQGGYSVPYSVPASRAIYDEPDTVESSFGEPSPALQSFPNTSSSRSPFDDNGDQYSAAPIIRRQGTSDSEILTPTVPSEKALGKLRRVSIREDSESDPVEQQRKLEEQLRARYTRE